MQYIKCFLNNCLQNINVDEMKNYFIDQEFNSTFLSEYNMELDVNCYYCLHVFYYN